MGNHLIKLDSFKWFMRSFAAKRAFSQQLVNGRAESMCVFATVFKQEQ